ncbi:hypothetical protein ACFL7D_08680 [candidate division KSB1 bacterium]
MSSENQSSKSLFSFELLPTFQNRDDFFRRITSEEEPMKKIISMYLLFTAFVFIYGIVMGSYHSPLQAAVSGVKVAVLFSLTLLICFPAFFIIQFILGSKLKLRQMLSIILSGFLMTSTIMVSFMPISVFFLLIGSDYYFLQLLHIGIFVFSGIFGMKTVVDALKFSCENSNIYPQTGVVIFRFWVIILAFVGIQLSWNLRPFLGDRGQPFEFFRKYEGNFYTALIYSVKQLMSSDDENSGSINQKINQINPNASFNPFILDTVKKEYK